MGKHTGKRISLWLDDELYAKLEKGRRYRSVSEYVRHLIDEGVPSDDKPKRAKPVASEHEKPREISDAEFWRAALATDPDRAYWEQGIKDNGSIAKLLKAMPANANIWQALEQ